jgi:hypothetical protein
MHKHPLSYENEETCHRHNQFITHTVWRKQKNYLERSMILVDASKPGRLVSGCEASDKNYFRVGCVDTIMSKLIL